MRSLAILACAAALCAGESFTPPAVWGKDQGNPVPVDGQPRWRLDQIFPGNPEDGAAYVTMGWAGDKWFNDKGNQSGQPAVHCKDGGNLEFGIRARGGGDLDYVKGAALVFMAPKDGRYSWSGQVDVWRWEGGATTFLKVMKRFKKGDSWSVEPLSSEALKPEKGNQLNPVEAVLKAGDELAIIPWHDGHWSGANVTLVKPTVTLIATGAAAAGPKLAAAIPFEPGKGGSAAGRPLPDVPGVANVRDFGAKGDGKTDDTAAIQKAISENRSRGGRIVYLPAGTYLVSDKLSYGDNLEQAKFLTIQGQGRDQSIIRLKDSAPGYDKRKAVLSQFEGKTTGMAFNNCVYDLTIDVGSGNPGAVALEWMNNNSGSCERVTLRAGKDSGHTGFDLTKHEPGPGLVRYLVVEGFDYGINSVQTCFSMTFEHVKLKGQRKAGIRNNTQTLFLRKILSENSVPALIFADETPYGAVMVYDSVFTGVGPEAAKVAAVIANRPQIELRNVSQTGYAKLVDLSKAKQPDLAGPGQKADWWPNVGAKTAAFEGTPAQMLNLPIEESPEIAWDPPAKWAVVNPKRLEADFDDSPAIQEALDWAAKNGRTSLLVPGNLKLGSPITVPAEIRRICGTDSLSEIAPDLARSTEPVWRIGAGKDPIVIERFFVHDFGNRNAVKNNVWIEHASQRTVVCGRGAVCGVPYRGLPASKGAKLFLEDLTIADLTITGQNVWMRQWNPETNGVMLTNNGGTVWIFGTKTETATGTWIRTTGGGKTEVLGGYIYPSWRHKDTPAPPPMFIVDDGSSFSACFKEQVFQGYMCYPVTIRQTRGSETKDLGRECYTDMGWVPIVSATPK